METEKNKSSWSLSKIAAGIFIIVALIAGTFYIYKASISTSIPSSSSSSSSSSKTTYKVAGSGSAGFALKFWAKSFEEKNPQISLEFLPSSDATIAYLGEAEKTIDIGVASRLPKPAEENAILEITPFVKDAIVLAVNDSVTGVSNLSKEEIIGIWSGTISNWNQIGGPDAKIIIIDREEDESAKKILRSLYIGETEVTGNALEVNSEGEVLQAISSTQYSIGMLSYARAKTNPKLVPLKLDGLGIEDVDSDKYQYTRTLYLITRKDSPAQMNSFLDFVKNSDLKSSFGFFKP